jgi:tetratricopeptide (TPR) repeat protein
VWWDLDAIQPGQRWREQIRRGLGAADAVLILIGPRWLAETDAKGRRRLSQRGDVVRAEVAEALRGRATVIPVLVGGVPMPEKNALPPSLARLTERQGFRLDDGRWKEDVDHLLAKLCDVVSQTREPLSLSDLRGRIQEAQSEYLELLSRNPRQALDRARNTIALLDQYLPLYPTDLGLQLERGYACKNEAMAHQFLGDADAYQRALDGAQHVFTVILREAEADLASAYNGVGSVTMLRGQLEESIGWIDRALALVPNYAAALDDRELARGLMAERRAETRPRAKRTRGASRSREKGA